MNLFAFFSINPNAIHVIVGSNKLSTGGSIYGVKDIISHGHFNKRNMAFDIGLIRVDFPIEFDDRVQPIAYSSKSVPPNVELEVFGWGRLKVRNSNYSGDFTAERKAE